MKIAIAHFRVGLTDGVSLEIDKREKILRGMGHDVVTIAGSHSGLVDLHIRHFEYKHHPKVMEVTKLAFQPGKEKELELLVEGIAEAIERDLEEFWEKERFEALLIHNLFCLPVCLPGTLAFYRFLKKHPFVNGNTTHHDFWWEPPRVATFSFTNAYAKRLLDDLFAPKLPNLKHYCINNLARKALKERKGIESKLITDTFDFEQPLWERGPRNADYPRDVDVRPDDLTFLIAVRVRERKAVELAIDMVGKMAELKRELVGKTKYDGTPITESSRVVLVIPGEFTERETDYVTKLQEKAESLGIEIRWIQTYVGSELEQEKGMKKYALWDCYVYTDAVLYTSHWEGWGNQFIEAVFAKKPVAVFEYPVFAHDIKTDGFTVSSLGSEYTTRADGLIEVSLERLEAASRDMLATLTDSDRYRSTVEGNFAIGRERYNTGTILKAHVEDMLEFEKPEV
jgi:hypothetical protein